MGDATSAISLGVGPERSFYIKDAKLFLLSYTAVFHCFSSC